MAVFDDPARLIRHVRQCFIFGDETGMSELVMENEDVEAIMLPSRTRLVGMSRRTLTENLVPQSFDIDVDPSYMSMYPNKARPNQMKQSRTEDSRIKVITWEEHVPTPSDEDRASLFLPKFVPKQVQKSSSSLSTVLSQISQHHLYKDYAKFDGEFSSSPSEVKTILVFLYIDNECVLDMPTKVVVQGSATVGDFIGLVLYKLSSEHKELKLKGEVSEFEVFMSDDGHADQDLPALEKREKISKFGFTELVIVKTKEAVGQPSTQHMVTIHAENGSSRIKVDSLSTKMSVILEKLLKKRGMKEKNYALVKKNSHGEHINLDVTLESMGCMEFSLIRLGTAEVEDNHHRMGPSCLEYKSFRVCLVARLRSSMEVNLGVSGLEIDIIQVSPAKSFLNKMKSVTISTESVVDCELGEEKPGSKTGFKIIVCRQSEVRDYCFEADTRTAEEVVRKITSIINLHGLPLRMQYLSKKEKRPDDRPAKRYSIFPS